MRPKTTMSIIVVMALLGVSLMYLANAVSSYCKDEYARGGFELGAAAFFRWLAYIHHHEEV